MSHPPNKSVNAAARSRPAAVRPRSLSRRPSSTLDLMKRRPLLEFKSSAFPVVMSEDDKTKLGIFGKALDQWLSEQLRARDFPSGDVIAKDFGWCVPLLGKPPALYVACARTDEAEDQWRVFAFAESGLISRIFGKDTDGESLETLYAAVKGILEATPQVQRLREEVA